MGDLMGVSINTKSESHFDDIIKKNNLEVYELDAFNAGDCTFHFGWTIHGAGVNISNKLREAMVVTYYPDGTRVGKLDNEARVHDAKVFLAGKKEGEIANNSINTIVYKNLHNLYRAFPIVLYLLIEYF